MPLVYDVPVNLKHKYIERIFLDRKFSKKKKTIKNHTHTHLRFHEVKGRKRINNTGIAHHLA